MQTVSFTLISDATKYFKINKKNDGEHDDEDNYKRLIVLMKQLGAC